MTPSCHDQAIVEVHSIEVGSSWMDLLVLFLRDRTLPKDKSRAKKIQRKAPRYWLFEEQKLYKCLFFRPYLFCVQPKAVEPPLEELHEGIYGCYRGRRSLSHRALTQGYW